MAEILRTLPFNALRTLEAVVRLRGFGRAAEELNVTQSAVSQHVKLLETWLGQKLLIRSSRQTTPTEAGERLANSVRAGFGGLQAVCDEIRGFHRVRENRILVGSPPGFAYVWLLPRLLSFDEQNPDISVSLSTDPQARTPNTGDADVFISYSTGGFPGLHAEPLMSEKMAPVCSPRIAETLKTIDDLSSQTILLDDLDSSETLSTWDFWAKECDKKLPRFQQTRKYGQANLVVQAAIQGLGVAMGRCPLVLDAIKNGQLVYPFDQFAASQYSYWLVCKHDVLKSKSVTVFRTWIQQEAKVFVKSLGEF